MPYAFLPDDPTVTATLRRIAEEQASAALRGLEDGAEGPLAPRVHGARKAVKKLRGLVRLVRPVLKGHARENAALRDAGRSIAGLRDAQVMQGLVERLGKEAGLKAKDRRALAAPFAAAASEAEDPQAMAAAVDGFRKRMEAVRERAADWRLEAEGFDALAPGLERTWTAARKAMKAARRDPEPEAMHDWRKRVKDHWYQARLLRPIWPEAMDPQIAAADRLGEALGDHHDLAVLAEALAGAGEAAGPVLSLARARQAALESEADALGRRLLAGPAEALTARWRVWWDVWKG